jgi:hypothetical protein
MSDRSKPWSGEFPNDRAEDMDEAAREILWQAVYGTRTSYAVDYMLMGSRVQWVSVVLATDRDDAFYVARSLLTQAYPVGVSIVGSPRPATDTDFACAKQIPGVP